ncbi:hypothetical protein F5882DRAFT_127272 [Hyaloscypha sp. PMI_1271]|nr:hypothetical protein F5882DRAFT_127272 [Hyaloscypha sp. PMI_1271]
MRRKGGLSQHAVFIQDLRICFDTLFEALRNSSRRSGRSRRRRRDGLPPKYGPSHCMPVGRPRLCWTESKLHACTPARLHSSGIKFVLLIPVDSVVGRTGRLVNRAEGMGMGMGMGMGVRRLSKTASCCPHVSRSASSRQLEHLEGKAVSGDSHSSPRPFLWNYSEHK